MPRRPRIHPPGILLHIVQRGRNRDACFFAGKGNCLWKCVKSELGPFMAFI